MILITVKNNIDIGFILAVSVVNDNGFLQFPIKGVIQLLWIEPKERKSGAAQQLLEQVNQCFISTDIHYVECSYTVKNILAKEFWNKQGYVETSTIARKILIEWFDL